MSGSLPSRLKYGVPILNRALQLRAQVHPRSTPHLTAPTAPKSTRSASMSGDKGDKSKALAMDAVLHPPSGLYLPNPLKGLFYGPDVVQKHILSCLPGENSKAFIITGNSLATKTPLIKQLEDLLKTRSAHAGTFANIKQHAPVAELDEAADKVLADKTIDTIISVGGGSPIDSAKVISYRCHERGGNYLTHITIPTTLSAAECSFVAGYTTEEGTKTAVVNQSLFPSWVMYDSKFALHSPVDLFASTGIRALDHAVEVQYHPSATLMPAHWMGLAAIRELFENLPKYKANPKDEEVILRLYLAAYASLAFIGSNFRSGLGLSHALGYALGSPYSIPHGITSCMTLGHVVKLKSDVDPDVAARVAPILDVLDGERRSGDNLKDAHRVGDRILDLVASLGYKTTLTEKGVGTDQKEIIVKRAMGGKMDDQDFVAKLTKLVEGLW